MPKPKQCRLDCHIDFRDVLKDRNLISVEVGPGQEILALAISGDPNYREIAASGASFARLRTESAHTFTILRYCESELSSVEIDSEHWNFHWVQPLPGEEYILVCARCRRYPDGTHDSNARIYGASGRVRREFLLGDGINRVQTTGDRRIWTSYFDEGVFGNFGWEQPIGASGLICWDAEGRPLFSYEPPSGLDNICDCYALNVVSDEETWIYYYTQFPLVRIRRSGEMTAWSCPLAGSDGFAVCDDFVLFRGGYRKQDIYSLFQLGASGTMTLRSTFQFTDRSGHSLKSCGAIARGSFLYLVRDACCFRVDIRELV